MNMMGTGPSPIPPRSRLFNMEPIGVGTPFVESLSGYSTRLAEQHCITTHHLFSKEIALHVNMPGTLSYSESCNLLSKTVNGTGGMVYDLIGALEHLTLRRDLRFTAMVSWKDAISAYSLTRAVRAWCPACYEDQLDAGAAVYDQLLWAIEAVSVCLRHQTRLELECPYCNRQQYQIAFRSRPGYCNRCMAWLGSRNPSRRHIGDAAEQSSEIATEMKIAGWVGDLLAITPSIRTTITTPVMLASLSKWFQDRCGGSYAAAWRLTSVKGEIIRPWVVGKYLPSLGNLLKICLALDVSLTDLLCASAHEISSPKEVLKSEAPSRSLAASEEEAGQVGGKARRRRRMDWSNPNVMAEVEGKLQSALEESPPRSIRSLCEEIGCTSQTITNKFPHLAAKIAKKSRAYYSQRMDVERAGRVLRLACKEEPPPTIGEISRRLGPGCSTASIRTKFPQEYRAIVERHARFRRRFDYEAIEKILRDSLGQEPPQSFAAICRRLGVPQTNVLRAHPEICALVQRRYVLYQREEIERRRALVVEEIEANVKIMLQEGVRPTIWALKSKRRVPCGKPRFETECRRILSQLGLC